MPMNRQLQGEKILCRNPVRKDSRRQSEYLLSNRGGNVVYFWHYTRSAAGSHRRHRSIHRPRCRNLPLEMEKNISACSHSSHRGAKIYFHSPKPLSQEQEGFFSLSPMKVIFFFKLVLASLSHQKGFVGVRRKGEGDIVSKVSSILCDLKALCLLQYLKIRRLVPK